ncbi:GYD domain-containing protein [Nordella sp. HKS 07]|uniref:GYD domain-containing protein n=1 Tax=Nordella sp. HKS 07 TaxID=2712222 RepID=UPI0013E1DC1F|nr:GYD domain-containing protein [Nordella sp. HKS 07]QIG50726.1 GYD domain-containing protein [Nordella sp. HKS 07]
MPTFIVLTNFTEQGIRAVKDTTKRADKFRDLAKQHGATVKELYWTLGKYDVVSIVEAPDVASMTALGLTLGMAGNVRTQTLPAFSADEMAKVLAKVK